MSAPVVGGAPDADHPGVVAIVERRARCDAPEAVRCSGTLVAPRVVLTAAHCLDGRRADELEVVIGADLRGPAGAALAVQDAAVHPGYVPGQLVAGRDLALLLLAAPAAVAPVALVDAPPPELTVGATVRLVALGAPADHTDGGQRLAADATVASVTATDLTIDGPGVPCGADSGGAAFLVTAAGERQVGVIKASGAGCVAPGYVTAIADELDGFVRPFVAMAATAPGPARPPIAALDACGATCATVDDCPLGMLCLPERDGSRCGYRELRAASFGDACASGDGCVPVGQGAERACALVAACDVAPVDDGCGCQSDGEPAAGLGIFLVAILALRRRERLAPRARTS
ncbi:MAG: trypsin-like serine protease [Myxococcales bacterium]|nr:trypsin-like serine protease [Myxococcales bacterium]